LWHLIRADSTIFLREFSKAPKVATTLVILSELPTFVLLDKTRNLWLKNRGFTNRNFEAVPPGQFAKQIIHQPKFAL
jgi:hypothetical protein